MSFLDQFQSQIKKSLLADENEADLEKAITIVIEERLIYWKRKEPIETDLTIGLCSLCVPIPICPPKSATYINDARAFRQKVLPGIADKVRLQSRFRSGIRVKLTSADPQTVKFDNFSDFFQILAESEN